MILDEASVRGLPEAVVPDNRTLQMLVNAYQICRDNILSIKRSRIPQAGLAALARELERTFLETLTTNRGQSPLLQADVHALRALLRCDEPAEAGIRCAAFLKAIARHVGDTLRREPNALAEPIATSPEVGTASYFVSSKLPDLMGLRLPASKRLPRTDDEVAEMPGSYHAGVDIWPERVEQWSLVRVPLRDPVTDTLLRRRARAGMLKVAMSPLTADADIRGRSEPGFPANEPARFLVDSVGVEPPQLAVITRLLEQCREEGVSILVLPELRMPPNFVSMVAEFLAAQSPADLRAGRGMLLVVAGSWHVRSASGRDWVNQATVLDHAGRRVWTHDKLAEFRITAQNVRDAPALSAKLNLNRHGGIENIRIGDRLEFCDFSIGRVAVCICVGFFHAPLEPLLKASRANVFLVPAMTPTTTDIAARGSALVRSQRAFTFVANCGAAARSTCLFTSPLNRTPTAIPAELLLWAPKLTDT